MKPAPRLSLTERCLHYERAADVPDDLNKYFSQRYSIFSKYEDGIQMTNDAWFGVTPEPVAKKIADDLAEVADDQKTTVVDLFAGAGGNTIAFALSGRWSRVVAVEKDEDTLACAQHNAEVYGCADNAVTWLHADSFEYLKAASSPTASSSPSQSSVLPKTLSLVPQETVLFASPPWGGIGYRDHNVFDLSTMQPYNLAALNQACREYDHLLYLPRTSDLRQIAKLAPKGENVDVVQYCMMGASKAMVAFIPGVLAKV